MPPYATANPRPFAFGAGPTGCLLLHGFAGSPAEVRPLGEDLAGQGLRVRGPLLPGHGTVPKDLNEVRWQDWVGAAEESLTLLQRECDRVWIGGLSMGALVAGFLAARHPESCGLLAYAPALRVANRLLPLTLLARHFVRQYPTRPGTDLTDPEAALQLWHYDTRPVAGAAQLWLLQRQMPTLLARVSVPALVMQSTQDNALHPLAGQRYYALLGSPRKTLAQYGRSGHCMLGDSERADISAQTWQWISMHTV